MTEAQQAAVLAAQSLMDGAVAAVAACGILPLDLAVANSLNTLQGLETGYAGLSQFQKGLGLVGNDS